MSARLAVFVCEERRASTGTPGGAANRLLVEGRVLDDAGSPVPSAPLALTLKSGDSIIDVAGVATPCGDVHPLGAARTDESGRFCVWMNVPSATYALHVDVAPTEWLGGTSADFTVDLAKASLKLHFDPEPRIVSLDARPAPLDAIATYDDEVAGPATGLALVLATETGDIARATTAAAGRATFAIDPKKLGAPGGGVLRVRYEGSIDTMPSEHVAPIERQARVLLALPHEIEASTPEDGVTIDVDASFASISGTPTGSVEARASGVVVGAAPIVDGHAKLVATFVTHPGEKTSSLQLRYVPDAPWLETAGDLAVTIPIRGPSPWRQVPLAIGAIAVAVWLLVGRSARRQRLDRTIVMERPPTHEGTAGIAMVKSSRSRVGLYSGRVVDAHDGAIVPRARISVQVAAFSGNPIVTSTFADEHGTFAFDLESAPPDADLVVEAPLHAELRQKLPGAGVLEIALVSRRRRLLERLVAWARRRGPPYDVRPEPTPAQVKRAAEGTRNAAAAEWANAVEQAAFDRDDVDARVEADVMALDPEKRR